MEGAGAPTIFDGRDVSAANLARIRAAYDADGVVCVRLLSAAKCEELVLEQWRHIILRQPWTDEYKIAVHGEDGRVLDVDRSPDVHAPVLRLPRHDAHAARTLQLRRRARA